MKWRLGLDVGTNSMGWAALEIADGIDDRGKALGKPVQLIDSGVRIFSDGRDPQSKESLAASRREPRGARRNRDRYIKRRTEFMDRLIEHGLMPSDKTKREELEKQDPWALRVHGLDEQLTLHQLGRALFHLQQRRGFKSNRKTDKGSDEKGAIKQAELQVKERMKEQGARTLGELLGRERVDQEKRNQTLPKGQRKPLTVARAKPTKVKNKNTYDFYPTRDMVAHEFDALWNQQKQYHRATLNDVAYDALANQDTSTGKQVGSLFFQRPLKPQPVGKCALYPHEEERAPKALASTQALRIYQEVNHLKLRQPGLAERKLTVEERSKIVANLLSSQKVSFDRIRKTLLKLPDASFSIESPKVKDLKGDLTAYILCQKPSAKVTGRWGPKWRDMPRDQQDAIVEILLGMDPVYGNDRENPAFAPAVQSIANALGIDEAKAKELLATNDEQNVINWLVEDFGFSRERAEAIESAPIPAGHGRLGRTATNKISPWLMSEQAEAIDPINNETRIFAPYTYDQSCRLGGYSHTPTPDGEVFDQLPYYGKVLERSVAFGTGDVDHKQEKRIGKIANPTVHVALNQIRAVVNALAKRYGTPQEIVVEVARDLPLSAKGKKDLDKQQTANKKANDARVAELTEHEQRNTYDNRMRMRLWEELNQNDKLNRCCVYTGEQIGIERLFSAEVEIEHILPRSRTLDDGFGNKTLSMKTANRYKGQRTPSEAFGDSKDGYDWAAISARADNLSDNKKWRFGPDAMERFDEKERGFLARQLGDTRYIARLTREYLTKMAGPYNVWVTTGHLTSELRHAWGLNSVLAGHNRAETEAEDIKKNRNDHRHHALDAVVIA
ncbi:CRISPR-associated endonuclease Cas9, partial [hydrothermal vent metagenome]